MANGNEKTCLTIGCSGINKNGPDKFRTEANNPDKQVCYFDGQSNNQMFNVFTSSRINQQETEKGIYFQIDRGTTSEDTFEVNTFLRKNGTNNYNSKKFGSGYRPAENRNGYDNDVKGS